MTNKMSKLTNLVLFGLFALSITAVSCNNKKDADKTDPVPDTATIKQTEPVPAQDTVPARDTTKMDTADTRPVKTPD
jgi:hypothetical protein